MLPDGRTLTFSRTSAIAFGIFLVSIETWRRGHQLGEIAMWPTIFDDYVAGALLVAGAVIATRSPSSGRTWLAAAWGWATGMMSGSFFGQLVEQEEPDPSGLPVACVLAVKCLMLGVCVAGLAATLAAPVMPRPARDESAPRGTP